MSNIRVPDCIKSEECKAAFLAIRTDPSSRWCPSRKGASMAWVENDTHEALVGLVGEVDWPYPLSSVTQRKLPTVPKVGDEVRIEYVEGGGFTGIVLAVRELT